MFRNLVKKVIGDPIERALSQYREIVDEINAFEPAMQKLSMDDMRASNSAIAPMRDRAGMALGGMPFVEEWEIAAMHRHHHSHQGACVRATWMHGAAADLDRGLDLFKMVTMPAMESLDGFCSASLFLDRATGRAVMSATYDSRELMMSSRDQAMDLRMRTAHDARVDVLDVAEFDLLMAHLRVPEMA